MSDLVRISSTSHRVEVEAEGRDDVVVDGKARVDRSGTTSTIDRVAGRLLVRVPLHSDVAIGTTSGRIEVRGVTGATSVVTESGRVEVEHAGSVDVRTESSRIEVGRVDGTCRVRSTSGKVQVGGCGDVDVATTSGRIELRDVGGTVRSHCVSGRIEIVLLDAHDVDAETVSGRISVSLPAGVSVHRPGGEAGPSADDADCTVSARSVSGRIDVTSHP